MLLVSYSVRSKYIVVAGVGGLVLTAAGFTELF